MSRSTLLQIGPLMPALEAALRVQHHVLCAQPVTAAAPLADMADAVRIKAVVTSAPVGVPAAWLAQLPALQVVSSFGVGLGRIGQAVARRATGFDMDIAYTNRGAVEGATWRFEPSLPALAQWADFLVLTVAASPATHHLVNAEVLRALGPQGLLVNVARGSVVDEAALIPCLQSGELGGAALDVFEDEPRVSADLLAMDQVVLAPHMASGTHDTRQAMADLVLTNLHAGLAGEPLPARAV